MPDCQKTALTTVIYSSTYFTVLQRVSKKTVIFQGFRGVQHFPGGVHFFQGGVKMLISTETRITYDFPGVGGPDPLSPLWIHTLGAA